MKLQSVAFERAVVVPWRDDHQYSFTATKDNGIEIRANEGWVFVSHSEADRKVERCFPVSMVKGATPMVEAPVLQQQKGVRR